MEKMTDELQELRDKLADKQAEIERLTAENKRLISTFETEARRGFAADLARMTKEAGEFRPALQEIATRTIISQRCDGKCTEIALKALAGARQRP